MDPELLTAIAAFVAAILSFGASIAGIISTNKKLRDERERWKRELEEEYKRWQKELEVDLESKFLHELVRRRFETYPAVLETLGAVRDVQDPGGEHLKSLQTNPKQLLETADRLLSHLYGEPGLFMEMETRNALLSAWKACLFFQTGSVTFDQLVAVFYQARRQIRSDLQLKDSKYAGAKTKLDELAKRFKEDMLDR